MNYQPDRGICERFQDLGLSVAESMVLTCQIDPDIEETWNVEASLELLTRHTEAIKSQALQIARDYRNQNNLSKAS